MANRGMTQAAREEAAKAQNQPVHLFEAHFDSAVSRVTDADRNIEWAGNTYAAVGNLLTFSSIRESAEARIDSVTVQLSGVSQEWIAAVLAETYIDRRLVIYKGFRDTRGNIIVDPVAIFDGRMDAPVIGEDPDEEPGRSIVHLEASSHWSDFERKPGRRTNDAIQRLHFPGDAFFDHVSATSRQVFWGRRSP